MNASSPPSRRTTALGDLPCSSEGIIEAFLRLINPPDFDRATDEVARSVCTNYDRSTIQHCCWGYVLLRFLALLEQNILVVPIPLSSLSSPSLSLSLAPSL